MKYLPKLIFTFSLACFLTPTWAHPGISHLHGFVSGFIHPWLGVDHWLAVFAVGLYAHCHGDNAIQALPLWYLVFMTLGVGLSASDIAVPAVEGGIVLSLFVMALVLIIKPHNFRNVMLPIIAYAALSQGYVHAEEANASDLILSQLLGLVLATSLLLALGLLTSRLSAKKQASLRLITSLSCFAIGTYALVG